MLISVRTVTIRAYGAQERFIKESYLKLNDYTRATRTFYGLNRYKSQVVATLGFCAYV